MCTLVLKSARESPASSWRHIAMKVIKMPLMTITLTLHGLYSPSTDPRDLIFQIVQAGHTERCLSLHSYILLPKSHPTNQFFPRAAFCFLLFPPSSYLLSVKASSVRTQTCQSFFMSLDNSVLLTGGSVLSDIYGALQRGAFYLDTFIYM